jgi:hypothetical protein
MNADEAECTRTWLGEIEAKWSSDNRRAISPRRKPRGSKRRLALAWLFHAPSGAAIVGGMERQLSIVVAAAGLIAMVGGTTPGNGNGGYFIGGCVLIGAALIASALLKKTS